MNRQPTPKVIGAFVIGFAIVAGAYVLSNFGQPPNTATTIRSVVETRQASARTAIAVTDNNDNGIEDWRDEFIKTDPIVVEESGGTAYEAPSTLTGQTGINFFQNVVSSNSFGPGDTNDQLVSKTISSLEQQSSHAIYDTPDIKVIRDYDEETVRAYANAVALAILENSETDLDYELYILQDVLNRGDQERIGELETLAELYRLTRDALLEVPVPVEMVKEHLDLINTLHALHHDVLGMTLAFDDPAYSLMRFKRYEDDIFGMIYALENIYSALEPYASLFSADDPAVIFTQFSPSNRVRI